MIRRLGEGIAGVFRSRRSTLALVLPGALLWLLFLVTSLRGADFGFHWDEMESHIGPTRAMVANGVLLPRIYTYPMLTKWMTLWPALPSGLEALFDGGGVRGVQRAILATMDAPGYVLSVRRLFIVVSSLTVVWTYAACLALGHRVFHATVAAAAIALSWEYSYHSRFAVPDCIVVQFSALALFGLAMHRRTGRSAWLYALAVVAGLATGTKYPAVFLLIPILLASVFSLPIKAVFSQFARGTAICAIAFFVYLVTTPATALDPFTFVEGAQNISLYYATVKHGGYTVDSLGKHVAIVFEYLTLDFYSHYRPLSVGLFVASLAGAVSWFRRDLRFGIVLFALPAIFVTFFCAKYRLVVVRNYLFFMPFLVVMLARAAADLEALLKRPWPIRAARIAWIALGVLQARFVVFAAESIRHVSPKRYVREALAYVREHPEMRFRVSPQVRAVAAEQRYVLPVNVTTGKADAVVFFNRSEGGDNWQRAANDPWLTLAVFGPWDVNVNYYPTWFGTDRVVVMTPEKARASLAPIAQ